MALRKSIAYAGIGLIAMTMTGAALADQLAPIESAAPQPTAVRPLTPAEAPKVAQRQLPQQHANALRRRQQLAQATGGDELQEIVVTARRREENIQKVPISISAVSGESLADHHITDATDLSKIIPSLVTAQTSRDEEGYTLRGSTNNGVTNNGSQYSVQPYINDVPYPEGDGAGPGRYFDIQTVEVDKGPQGTLFGRNATGGAVRVITNKPTNDFEGNLSFQYGSFNDEDVQGMINLPIIKDKVLLRIAGERETRDGFTKNLGDPGQFFGQPGKTLGSPGHDFDNRDYWSERVSLTVRPNEDFENITVFDSYYSDNNGPSEIIQGYNPGHVLSPLTFGNTTYGFVHFNLVFASPISTNVFGNANQSAVAAAGTVVLSILENCHNTPNCGPQNNYNNNPTLAAIAKYGIGIYPLSLASTQPNNPIFAAAGLTSHAQLGVLDALALSKAAGPRAQYSGVNPIDKNWSMGVSNTSTWDVNDDLTIKNIFGYRQLQNLTRLDQGGDILPVLSNYTLTGPTVDYSQYTEEFQLQGKALHEKLNWIAGAFGLFGHRNGFQETQFGELQALNGEANTVDSAGGVNQVNIPDNYSEALFGQGTYDLAGLSSWLDGFKFTGGYRWTWDRRRVVTSQVNPSSATCGDPTFGVNTDVCPATIEVDSQAPSWEADVDYQVTDSSLVYVKGRRGYRAGGANPLGHGANACPNTQYGVECGGGAIFSYPDFFTFKPEIVKDVEVGAKADWNLLGMKGRTNVALYHDDIQNKQANESFQEINPNPAANSGYTVDAIVNAASATDEGIEFDTTIIPTSGLNVTLSWAYNKAAYNNFIFVGGPNGTTTIAQEPYPFTPLNSFVVDARYHLPLPDTYGDFSVAANDSYRTHQSLSVSPDPFGTQLAYNLVDLHMDWSDVMNRPIDASFSVSNLTDTLYKIGGYPVYDTLGMTSLFYGEPRTFSFRVKWHWGPGSPGWDGNS